MWLGLASTNNGWVFWRSCQCGQAWQVQAMAGFFGHRISVAGLGKYQQKLSFFWRSCQHGRAWQALELIRNK